MLEMDSKVKLLHFTLEVLSGETCLCQLHYGVCDDDTLISIEETRVHAVRLRQLSGPKLSAGKTGFSVVFQIREAPNLP